MNKQSNTVNRLLPIRFLALCATIVMSTVLTSSPLLAQHRTSQGDPAPRTRQGLVDAPEIDPALLTGAVVLVSGGALILTERVRRKA